MTGLNNLASVGDLYIIANQNLSSLEGLDSLSSISNSLKIGGTNPDLFEGNESLTDLSALENLTSIGNVLVIGENNALTNLSGLDNVSIGGNLNISNNLNLSSCDAESICNFLENGGDATIEDNAPGCNSEEEVEEACGIVSTEEAFAGKESILMFPNPATDFLKIHFPETNFNLVEISLFNSQGKKVGRQIISSGQAIDLIGLPKGMYLVKAVVGERFYCSKFVKN